MGSLSPAMLTSDNQEWETPLELFNAIQIKHNFMFDADMAASKKNHLLKKYLTRDGFINLLPNEDYVGHEDPEFLVWNNFLQKEYKVFNLFCNCPYGDPEFKVGVFVSNAMCVKNHHNSTLLLPTNKSDQPWFAKYCKYFFIEFVEGRIQFLIDGKIPEKWDPKTEKIKKSGNTQGSILLHTGPRWEDRYGTHDTFNWKLYKKVIKGVNIND